jgi:hypothetical protein
MVQLNKVDMELTYFHHDNLVTNQVKDILGWDGFLMSKKIININAYLIFNTIALYFFKMLIP